jgi:hypothetical protein
MITASDHGDAAESPSPLSARPALARRVHDAHGHRTRQRHAALVQVSGQDDQQPARRATFGSAADCQRPGRSPQRRGSAPRSPPRRSGWTVAAPASPRSWRPLHSRLMLIARCSGREPAPGGRADPPSPSTAPLRAERPPAPGHQDHCSSGCRIGATSNARALQRPDRQRPNARPDHLYQRGSGSAAREERDQAIAEVVLMAMISHSHRARLGRGDLGPATAMNESRS